MVVAQPPGLTPFNPLDSRLATPNLILRAQRNTVANILESYHGRYDSFAELLQNAVDAISRRWKAWGGPGSAVPDGDISERPQIRITIDCTANRIRVVDNGSGMEDAALRVLLIPNVTDKADDPDEAGHKGVGTTYLAYGHNLIEIETKTPGAASSYRMLDGLIWSKSRPIAQAPEFVPVPMSHDLDDFGRGTAITVAFGQGTNYGNLAGTFYNSLDLWDRMFRSFTAAGRVDVEPVAQEWVNHLAISVDLRGVPGAGNRTIQFQFAYPHKDLPAAETAELQVLQNSPHAANRYKLVYLKRDHTALMQLLQPELDALQNSSDSSDQELHQDILSHLTGGSVAAYASLAWTNTLYEENWKQAICQPGSSRLTAINVRGGVLMSSVGVPMGELLPHRENYRVLKPEERRRFFLLVHINNTYHPDVGRKTIPREWEPTVGWLEWALLRILRQYNSRLQVSHSDATHNAASYSQAQEQLQQAITNFSAHRTNTASFNLPEIIPDRTPSAETEVISIFVSLLSQSRLKGYRILAIPGNSARYDGLFNIDLDLQGHQKLQGAEAELSVSDTQFHAGKFVRTNQWLEFKLKLAELIDEFELSDGEPNKKYYEQLHLAVCWTVTLPTNIAGYSLFEIDANARLNRNFPGSTHFLKKDGSPHTVEVMELKSLIERLSGP